MKNKVLALIVCCIVTLHLTGCENSENSAENAEITGEYSTSEKTEVIHLENEIMDNVKNNIDNLCKFLHNDTEDDTQKTYHNSLLKKISIKISYYANFINELIYEIEEYIAINQIEIAGKRIKFFIPLEDEDNNVDIHKLKHLERRINDGVFDFCRSKNIDILDYCSGEMNGDKYYAILVEYFGSLNYVSEFPDGYNGIVLLYKEGEYIGGNSRVIMGTSKVGFRGGSGFIEFDDNKFIVGQVRGSNSGTVYEYVFEVYNDDVILSEEIENYYNFIDDELEIVKCITYYKEGKTEKYYDNGDLAETVDFEPEIINFEDSSAYIEIHNFWDNFKWQMQQYHIDHLQ